MANVLIEKLGRVVGLRRFSREVSIPPANYSAPEEVLELNFPNCTQRDFPREFPAAWQAVQDTLASIRGADLRPLARHSPALNGFDWTGYITLSVIRMVRAQSALWGAGCVGGRLLDLGAYFGNFSLMFARNGYHVDALDSYSEYAEAFAGIEKHLIKEGARILDAKEAGQALKEIPSDTYDIIACMGVIEHIPHTPRLLLEGIKRVLRPGGLLVLDTPNLGYVYNRQKLGRGETIFCPIDFQYFTELPFEGHHREYTRGEILWLLNQLNHEVIQMQAFNYSLYGLSTLSGIDLDNFRASEQDESLREVILSLSRKPAA